MFQVNGLLYSSCSVHISLGIRVIISGDKDIYLVLDGQQRMTSFYVGLLGTYRYFYYRWRNTRLYLNILKPPLPNEGDPEELTFQFEFLEDVPSNDGESKF